jgi:aspartyl-tRNA(Asn)/glutamyl-tRNA(Gln) amidotransferase subunit C
MSLSNDQIRRIARLARIAVGAEEAEAVRERLNRVLGLIDQLQAVDTTGIEPMSHALDAHLSHGQPLRPDAVTESDQRARFQTEAPAVEGGLYLVPKVIE